MGFTISFNYMQSNGLAEKDKRISKKKLKRYELTCQDLKLCIFDYKTSIAGLSYSPSQLLMNKILKTYVPINKNLLDLFIPINPHKKYSNIERNEINTTIKI